MYTGDGGECPRRHAVVPGDDASRFRGVILGEGAGPMESDGLEPERHVHSWSPTLPRSTPDPHALSRPTRGPQRMSSAPPSMRPPTTRRRRQMERPAGRGSAMRVHTSTTPQPLLV